MKAATLDTLRMREPAAMYGSARYVSSTGASTSRRAMAALSGAGMAAKSPNVPKPALLTRRATRAPGVSASARSSTSNDAGSVRSSANGRTRGEVRSARRETAQIWSSGPK